MVLIAALITSGTLTALALLHVAWALGSYWPASNAADLADLVIGRTPGQEQLPGRGLTFLVAVLLLIAALLVLATSGLLPLPLSMRWVRIGATGLAAVLLLRGFGGFFDLKLRPSIAGTAYARANVRYYSPLCLLLAAGTALVLSGT